MVMEHPPVKEDRAGVACAESARERRPEGNGERGGKVDWWQDVYGPSKTRPSGRGDSASI